MSFSLSIPRLHLFEIDDQAWFPPLLRNHVQSALTLLWTLRIPLLQPCSPATLVARKLQALLGDSINEYTFVDFCSGAGGPTCEIERVVNEALRAAASGEARVDGRNGYVHDGDGNEGGESLADRREGLKRRTAPKLNGSSPQSSASAPDGVDFILTDLHPHIPAWRSASQQSPHIHYVPCPIDAASAPSNLLSLAEPRRHQPLPQKQIHLFSLAFHHFPDPLARRILRSTTGTACAFAVFELQARTLGSLFTILMLAPVLWAVGWWRFWGRWGLLFWIYVLPVVPVVVVLDGLVSCLRTRWGDEVEALMVGGNAGAEGWTLEWGSERHSWPSGEMGWVFGKKA